MIAVLFEFLFQIFLEVFLQMFIEVLFHLGWNSVAEALDRKPVKNHFLALVGYALMGVAAGGISLLVFPELFVTHPTLRAANVIITPLLAGLLMAAYGEWRERRGLTTIRLDSFSYGYIFAAGVALIRYFFGGQ